MKLEKSKNNILWIIVGIVLINGIGITVVFPLLPFLLGPTCPLRK